MEGIGQLIYLAILGEINLVMKIFEMNNRHLLIQRDYYRISWSLFQH